MLLNFWFVLHSVCVGGMGIACGVGVHPNVHCLHCISLVFAFMCDVRICTQFICRFCMKNRPMENRKKITASVNFKDLVAKKWTCRLYFLWTFLNFTAFAEVHRCYIILILWTELVSIFLKQPQMPRLPLSWHRIFRAYVHCRSSVDPREHLLPPCMIVHITHCSMHCICVVWYGMGANCVTAVEVIMQLYIMWYDYSNRGIIIYYNRKSYH